MNDFTKQELQMIYSMLLHIRNDYPSVRKDEDACCLKHKIQSMIDRYCEHESDEFENLDICKHCDKRFR